MFKGLTWTVRQYERKLDGKAEAYLIALACSPPPAGRKRWSLRLLAEKLVTLEQVDIDSISHETVRQVPKNRTQALSEKAVGDSTQSECRLCLPYGRRAGPRTSTISPMIHGIQRSALMKPASSW